MENATILEIFKMNWSPGHIGTHVFSQYADSKTQNEHSYSQNRHVLLPVDSNALYVERKKTPVIGC